MDSLLYDRDFIIGKNNPIGLHLEFSMKDGHAECDWTADENYVGYNNIIHGGITTALLDEMMSFAGHSATDRNFVTVSIKTDFKIPVFSGDRIHISADAGEISDNSRKFTAHGVIEKDGKVAVESEGIFVILKESEDSIIKHNRNGTV